MGSGSGYSQQQMPPSGMTGPPGRSQLLILCVVINICLFSRIFVNSYF